MLAAPAALWSQDIPRGVIRIWHALFKSFHGRDARATSLVSFSRRVIAGQNLSARKFAELTEAVLQLVGRVLDSFTEVALRRCQLFLGEQDLSETNY